MAAAVESTEYYIDLLIKEKEGRAADLEKLHVKKRECRFIQRNALELKWKLDLAEKQNAHLQLLVASLKAARGEPVHVGTQAGVASSTHDVGTQVEGKVCADKATDAAPFSDVTDAASLLKVQTCEPAEVSSAKLAVCAQLERGRELEQCVSGLRQSMTAVTKECHELRQQLHSQRAQCQQLSRDKVDAKHTNEAVKRAKTLEAEKERLAARVAKLERTNGELAEQQHEMMEAGSSLDAIFAKQHTNNDRTCPFHVQTAIHGVHAMLPPLRRTLQETRAGCAQVMELTRKDAYQMIQTLKGKLEVRARQEFITSATLDTVLADMRRLYVQHEKLKTAHLDALLPAVSLAELLADCDSDDDESVAEGRSSASSGIIADQHEDGELSSSDGRCSRSSSRASNRKRPRVPTPQLHQPQ